MFDINALRIVNCRIVFYDCGDDATIFSKEFSGPVAYISESLNNKDLIFNSFCNVGFFAERIDA